MEANRDRSIKIMGTGKYLPGKTIYSEDLDREKGRKPGFTEKRYGISKRHYVDKECASDMAVRAIHNALGQSGLTLDDVDCLIAASGTMEQAIPYNAANVHAKLKPQRPIEAFDVNMTCMSFLKALDLASFYIKASHYRNIVICSSEVASIGIDFNCPDTSPIFADGAAAVIVGPASEGERAGVIASRFETHSEGADLCRILGAGTKFHPRKVRGDYERYCLFEMNGKELYRFAIEILPGFIQRLLNGTGLTMQDIDWVVPHQPSHQGLKYIRKKIGALPEQFINIFSEHGNQVAVSLPTAFHELRERYPVKPGDKVLLLGVSAGVSWGGMLLTV